MKALDVSRNVSLRYLYCYYNFIASLDLSNNSELESVYCYYNALTKLDVTRNAKLRYLSCYNNAISALDVSNCPLLENLSCSNNQIASLKLSNCKALTSLSCSYNQLTELDLSHNTKLDYLSAQGNYNTLKSIILPETLKTISGWSLDYNYALTDIDIPASVTSIGSGAFYRCTALRTVTLHSVTPPAGGADMFRYTHSELIIVVPKEAVAAYKAAEYWKEYADRITFTGSGDNEDIGYIYW